MDAHIHIYVNFLLVSLSDTCVTQAVRVHIHTHGECDRHRSADFSLVNLVPIEYSPGLAVMHRAVVVVSLGCLATQAAADWVPSWNARDSFGDYSDWHSNSIMSP